MTAKIFFTYDEQIEKIGNWGFRRKGDSIPLARRIYLLLSLPCVI